MTWAQKNAVSPYPFFVRVVHILLPFDNAEEEMLF